MAEKAAQDRKIDDILAKHHEKIWKRMDVKKDAFHLASLRKVPDAATISSPAASSLCSIFLKMLPISFLERVWKYHDKSRWQYGSKCKPSTINTGNFSASLILKYLAVYVHICGKRQVRSENQAPYSAKEVCIHEARDFLQQFRPGETIIGIEHARILLANYTIPKELYKELNVHLRSVISQPGLLLVCDEKLLHFTGDSAMIMKVPHKPDGIGLWFYEGTVKLSNALPYLIYLRVQDSGTIQDKVIHVAEVVSQWGAIVLSYPHAHQNSGATLLFDSYYTVNDARRWLNEHNVQFIASYTNMHMPNLGAAFQKYGTVVSQPGDTSCLYCEATGELIVDHFDRIAQIGRKHVFSNAFEHVHNTRATHHIAPAYDEYNAGFNACDRFNRALHDRIYCLRVGGYCHPGEEGHVHRFIMGAILENTFNVAKALRPAIYNVASFETMCDTLAQQLIKFAFDQA